MSVTLMKYLLYEINNKIKKKNDEIHRHNTEIYFVKKKKNDQSFIIVVFIQSIEFAYISILQSLIRCVYGKKIFFILLTKSSFWKKNCQTFLLPKVRHDSKVDGDKIVTFGLYDLKKNIHLNEIRWIWLLNSKYIFNGVPTVCLRHPTLSAKNVLIIFRFIVRLYNIINAWIIVIKNMYTVNNQFIYTP